jgi:hypothetical protein
MWSTRSVNVVLKTFLFETSRKSHSQLNVPFHFFSKWELKELYYYFNRHEIYSGEYIGEMHYRCLLVYGQAHRNRKRLVLNSTYFCREQRKNNCGCFIIRFIEVQSFYRECCGVPEVDSKGFWRWRIILKISGFLDFSTIVRYFRK